ncbi:MAG: HepT-like ribonuclease domain-containing protein [bacterium]
MIRPTDLLRKERILEYLDNMLRQLEDIRSIPVSSPEFFLKKENAIPIKAIKFSLACAIQDVTRVCAHIASALSLWKIRESESEAIVALGEAGILPKDFAEKIKKMPAFRNRILHDYLPNELDARRLFESLQELQDFETFSRLILNWLQVKKKGT